MNSSFQGRVRRINDLARAVSRTSKIDVELALRQWGEITAPYSALYGTASGAELADMFATHKEDLLRENLRFVLDKSNINLAIGETLKTSASSFWYYNNGITAICEAYTKKPLGGSEKDVGSFRFEGISVVNGAQTIGALGRAKAAGVDLTDARVLFRIVSLEGTPDGFAKAVTTANNTQNEVQLMDFAALDERQAELLIELRKLGLTYSYRRGEPEPDPTAGFDLRAATVALACASPDLRLAVQAKRYISGLWEDPSREPYTLIFPEGLSAAFVWNAVRIMRVVDKELTNASAAMSGKERLIAIHGNRFILHCIFKTLDLSKMPEVAMFDPQLETVLIQETKTILEQTRHFILEKYPESYPGNLFKNQDRQIEIMQSFKNEEPAPGPMQQKLL